MLFHEKLPVALLELFDECPDIVFNKSCDPLCYMKGIYNGRGTGEVFIYICNGYISQNSSNGGGDTIGTTTTPGKRDLPSSLVNLWHKGSFGSAEASINYHFKIHGSELRISNIRSYVENAQNFRGNLKGATESNVNGVHLVLRDIKNGKYIDICGSKNTGKIISYGKQ